MELSARQRQHLKGLAHHLKPIVHVGKEGLSEPLRKQIDLALERHELIKLRMTEGSPLGRDEVAGRLPAWTGAFLVQNIGKVFVLYRPHPEKPRITLPWPVAEAPPEPAAEAVSVAEARQPKARPAGGLLGSVRERGARPARPAPKPAARPTSRKRAPSRRGSGRKR